MIGSAIVQIIKTNEKRSGSKEGRAWEMQDCECLLLNDQMQPEQVGVLSLPKHLMGDNAPAPGVYTGSFSLRAGMRDRRIEAVLTNLVPVPQKTAPSGKSA